MNKNNTEMMWRIFLAGIDVQLRFGNDGVDWFYWHSYGDQFLGLWRVKTYWLPSERSDYKEAVLFRFTFMPFATESDQTSHSAQRQR